VVLYELKALGDFAVIAFDHIKAVKVVRFHNLTCRPNDMAVLELGLLNAHGKGLQKFE